MQTPLLTEEGLILFPHFSENKVLFYVGTFTTFQSMMNAKFSKQRTNSTIPRSLSVPFKSASISVE